MGPIKPTNKEWDDILKVYENKADDAKASLKRYLLENDIDWLEAHYCNGIERFPPEIIRDIGFAGTATEAFIRCMRHKRRLRDDHVARITYWCAIFAALSALFGAAIWGWG